MNIYIYALERNYRKNRTNVCILLLIWYNINCVSFIKDIIYNMALLNNKTRFNENRDIHYLFDA